MQGIVLDLDRVVLPGGRMPTTNEDDSVNYKCHTAIYFYFKNYLLIAQLSTQTQFQIQMHWCKEHMMALVRQACPIRFGTIIYHFPSQTIARAPMHTA